MTIRRQQSVVARHSAPERRLIAGGLPRETSSTRPDLLLCALTLVIWTYVWRVQDLFPVLGMVKLNLIAAVLSIGLFAIDRHPARALGRLKSPILFCVLALLVVMILGVPQSLWATRTITFLAKEFVPNLLLMVLLAASVRNMRDLEWIALVNLLGASFYSLFVGVKFDVDSTGRLDDLIYYDANDVALVLVCTIPFGVFFLVKGGLRHRLLAAVSLILFVTTIVRSGSRGGFLGFVALSAYMVLRYRAVPARMRILAVAGGFGLLTLVASDAYWERIRALRNPQQDYNWSGRATEGRMEVWKRGMGYMAAHPFLGVGLRNFPLAEGTLSEASKMRSERGAGFKWSVAHNSFIEIGAEVGMIGLALFLAMLGFALVVLARIRSARLNDRSSKMEMALADALSASFVGYIVSGFFVSAAYFSYLYMLLGLVIGFTKLDRYGQARPVAWQGWHRGFSRRGALILPPGRAAAASRQLRGWRTPWARSDIADRVGDDGDGSDADRSR